MNPIKNIWAGVKTLAILVIGCAALLAGVESVHAQGGNVLDLWEQPRLHVLQGETNIFSGAATSQTNGPFDLRGLDGVLRIDVNGRTNVGNGAGTNQSATIQFYVSPDQTNLISLTNFALVTTNTLTVHTNGYYGANTNYTYAVTNGLLATNLTQLPFTRTFPNAATAGFATPYNAPFPFTNGGSITMPLQGNISLGFQMGSLPTYNGIACRYIYCVFTTGATTNNWSYGATLLGVPRQP